jgi:Recombination endonuclease VII
MVARSKTKEYRDAYKKTYMSDPKNVERQKERSRAWYLRNRDELLGRWREQQVWRLRKTFWTRERFEEFLQHQQGLCAICGKPMKKVNADHDHKRKKPRALLCPRCNSGVGYIEQGGPEWVEAVMLYLLLWSRESSA